MKEILGLALLSSPLFLVIPWLFVAVWAAVKTSQPRKSAVAKLAAGAATLILVFLLPFADDIAGRIYFNHLCSSEAGVKVNQTVELPAKYWDVKGAVNFPLVKDNYISSYKEDRDSRFFWIDRVVYSLHEKTGKVLVEDVVFRNWGGWVVRILSPHNTASSCGAGSMNVVFKRTNQK